ncbi:Secondary metabolite protein [Streptomyces sp. 8N706]|uniref:Secondary metabolite protein n=1 Tax=Streptomyces sp. 8N706 TaxID=3457416 RepID=UPI003FCFF101
MTDRDPAAASEDPHVTIAAATFAEKLDYLFKNVHPPGRGPYTYAEVADGIREANAEAAEVTGKPAKNLTASAIQQLRTEPTRNPTYPTIKALANFFGVKAGYFFDEDEAEEAKAKIAVLAAMRDKNVKKVALRARGLSTDSLEMVSTVIEQARRLEGLTGDEADDDLDLDN